MCPTEGTTKLRSAFPKFTLFCDSGHPSILLVALQFIPVALRLAFRMIFYFIFVYSRLTLRGGDDLLKKNKGGFK